VQQQRRWSRRGRCLGPPGPGLHVVEPVTSPLVSMLLQRCVSRSSGAPVSARNPEPRSGLHRVRWSRDTGFFLSMTLRGESHAEGVSTRVSSEVLALLKARTATSACPPSQGPYLPRSVAPCDPPQASPAWCRIWPHVFNDQTPSAIRGWARPTEKGRICAPL